MPEETTGNAPLEVSNLKLISIDEIKFVFYQAEKRLEESIKAYDSTTRKSTTLITLITAIFSTLSSFFFLRNDVNGQFNVKLFTVLCLSIYSFIILIYLSRNILPVNYQPIGSLPNDLLSPKFYENCSEATERAEYSVLKDMYYSELVNYEGRIKKNFEVNKTMLARVKYSTCFLIILPAIGIVVYFSVSAILSLDL